MTIQTQTSRNEFTGNCERAAFPYRFRILDQSHLQVYVDCALKTLGTHYSVTNVGEAAGGQIVLATAPNEGEQVVILRKVPYTQTTDYVEGSRFPAESHERALDKLTMIVQQQDEQLGRALKLPVNSLLEDVDFPAPGAGSFFRWSADGTRLEAATITATGVATATLTGSLKANLGTTDEAGTLRRVTDNIRGVWMSTGSGYFQITGSIVNIAEFGAKPNDTSAVSTNTTAIQAAGNAAQADNGVLYVPPGVWSYLTSDCPTIEFSCIARLAIVGAGSAVSILKRASNVLDNSGTTTSRMLRLSNIQGTKADVTIRGIHMDGNVDGQTAPSPTNTYAQSHAIQFAPTDCRGFRTIHVEDVLLTAHFGGGMNFAGQANSEYSVGHVSVVNFTERDRPFTRSGIEITCPWETFSLTNATLSVFEVEPNFSCQRYAHQITLTNVHMTEEIDVGFSGGTPRPLSDRAMLMSGSNVVICGNANIFGMTTRFNGFQISQQCHGNSMRLGCDASYFFSNGCIHAGPGFLDKQIVLNAGSPMRRARFENVIFSADPGLSNCLEACFVDNDQSATSQVEFIRCEFRPTFAVSACLRSGRFSFIDSLHCYNGSNLPTVYGAIHYQLSTTGECNELRVYGNRICDLSYLVSVCSASTGVRTFYARNNHVPPGRTFNFGQFSRLAPPYGTGTDIFIRERDDYVASDWALTSTYGSSLSSYSCAPGCGHFLRGDRFYFADPCSVGAMGAIATASGMAKAGPGASGGGEAAWAKFGGIFIDCSLSFNPSAILDGAGCDNSVTVAGAALGDFVRASFSQTLSGIILIPSVTSANTVNIRLQNETAGTVNLLGGVLRIRVEKGFT